MMRLTLLLIIFVGISGNAVLSAGDEAKTYNDFIKYNNTIAESGRNLNLRNYSDAIKIWDDFIAQNPDNKYLSEAKKQQNELITETLKGIDEKSTQYQQNLTLLKQIKSSSAIPEQITSINTLFERIDGTWHQAILSKTDEADEKNDFKQASMTLTDFINKARELSNYTLKAEERLVILKKKYELPGFIKLGDKRVKSLSDNSEMLLIPAGEFITKGTGNDSKGNPPIKTVVDAFYMDKYEITVVQYRLFCSATNYKMPIGEWLDKDSPIANVSYENAEAYCVWTGRRLPTEAEWEYAALRNDQIPIPNSQNSDDESKLTDYAWFIENSDKQSHPVGQKLPNQYGLYDMYGNVWEWCQDWYNEDYYGKSPKANPAGPIKGIYRIVRGGAWNSRAEDISASNRCCVSPVWQSKNTGFRTVISANK